MSKKLPAIIVGIIIIAVVSIIVLNNSESSSNTPNDNTKDLPNIVDSTVIDANTPDSFIDKNGTKTYIINAIDSPVLKP